MGEVWFGEDFYKVTTQLSNTTNDAASVIEASMPYTARIAVQGVCPMLFHAWSVDGVEAKAKAAKGSRAKKQDDIETYVYRDSEGILAIPSEYFRMSIINAAKFKQDPRSPRKSAMDIFRAGVFATHELCPLGKKDWDFVDRRRVMVQRNGITRCRPAVNAGWQASLELEVVLPEYVTPGLLNEVTQMSGRLIGVGDFRPTFGRFQVVSFSVEAA